MLFVLRDGKKVGGCDDDGRSAWGGWCFVLRDGERVGGCVIMSGVHGGAGDLFCFVLWEIVGGRDDSMSAWGGDGTLFCVMENGWVMLEGCIGWVVCDGNNAFGGGALFCVMGGCWRHGMGEWLCW